MNIQEIDRLRVRLRQNSANKVVPVVLRKADSNDKINNCVPYTPTLDVAEGSNSNLHEIVAEAIEAADPFGPEITSELHFLKPLLRAGVINLLKKREESIKLFTQQLTKIGSELSKKEGVVSVIDEENPYEALSVILALPTFDPEAPRFQVELLIKTMVSLLQLSQRDDNLIEVQIKWFNEVVDDEEDNDDVITPVMDFNNIEVEHCSQEFFTFCSCRRCLEYRELIIHFLVEQFKITEIVSAFTNRLISTYAHMLKNPTSLNKLDELLKTNRKVYMISCGFIYKKRVDYLDFIYDKTLSNELIFILFSSILMVNNPLLLLQLLSFHIECVVKAYFEGFGEVLEPEKSKEGAEKIINYIIDGFDNLCRISSHVAYFLFEFENDFLRHFDLSWELLCERMYQQHVYLNLADTMLGCVFTLCEDAPSSVHEVIIWKYIKFHEKMLEVEKCWVEVWQKLNKYNMSDVERSRRKELLNLHQIFETIIHDTLAFSLTAKESVDDYYKFLTMTNRRAAWKNLMVYTRSRFPKGFYDPPITLLRLDNCKKCGFILDHHTRNCKCITCSIAGGPLPATPNTDLCFKCIGKTNANVETVRSDSNNAMISEIDGIKVKNKNMKKTIEKTSEEILRDAIHAAPPEKKVTDEPYHISWAVFRHFNNRIPYPHNEIADKYFCVNCKIATCVLARSILNNEISRCLSLFLIHHYQPIETTEKELRATLKNIRIYNTKMVASATHYSDLHNVTIRIYWTFIISLFATYFLQLEGKYQINLDGLEIVENDIKVREDVLVNNDDTQFFTFLDNLKDLYPRIDGKYDPEFEKNYDKAVDTVLKRYSTNLKLQNRPPPNALPDPKAIEPEGQTLLAKKPARDKSHPPKCCFDHADLAEHCKDTHANRKRVKKECNHGRMNETRDRLRKKLSKLVSARNGNADVTAPPPQKSKMNDNAQQQQQQQPAVATTEPSSVAKNDKDKSTSKLAARLAAARAKPKESIPAKESPIDNALTMKVDKSTKSNNNNQSKGNNVKDTAETKGQKSPNDVNDEDDTTEWKNRLTKDYWMKQVLNFIEGEIDTNDGRKQPAPSNPKKAAKKAKQKMRKEEEKRIAELHDFRAQFHDIYFKEFFEKNELKTLKSSKKRDKKRINELETNIKNLQRAKSKIETAILELIATVKQTNTEFKFSYLPTKEQQMEKLNEMSNKETDETKNSVAEAKAEEQETASASSADPIIVNPPQEFLYHHMGHPQNMAGPHMNVIGMPGPIYYTPSYPPALHPGLPIGAIPCVAPPNMVPAPASMDPSKRIVTIRRINLPNIPEPQVTVTAKGTSPDKDKLLYTFVNGQLVQAHPVINQQPSSPIEQQNAPISMTPSNVPAPLSKTQLKKERKRLAKLEKEKLEAEMLLQQQRQQQQLQQQVNSNKSKRVESEKLAEQQLPKKKNRNSSNDNVKGKPSKSPESAEADDDSRRSSTSTLEAKTSKQKPTQKGKQTVTKPAKQEAKTKPKEKEQPKKKDKKMEKEKAQQESTKQMELTKASKAVTVDEPEKKKRTKRSNSFQFDNNPYKSLHMQDSDSQDSNSDEEDTDDDDDTVEMEVTKPKISTANAASSAQAKKTDQRKEKQPIKKPEVIVQPTNDAKQKQKSSSGASDTKTKQSENNSMGKQGKDNKKQAATMDNHQSNTKRNEPMQQSTKAQNAKQINAKTSNNNSNSSSTIRNGNGKDMRTSYREPDRDSLTSEKSVTNRKNSKQQQKQQQVSIEPNNNNMMSGGRTTSKKSQNQQNNQRNNNNNNNNNNSVSGKKQNVTATLDNNNGMQHSTSNIDFYNQNKRQPMSSYNQNSIHSLPQQMQGLNLSNYPAPPVPKVGYNVSIMDQLNRGVEVENLSLPPGITLTKVDPDKSEQLRQKSESISKVCKPLQPQSAPTYPYPPTYYGAAPPFASVAAGGIAGGASGYDQSGIIMVEASPKTNTDANANAGAMPSTTASKLSKNKKRRKGGNSSSTDSGSSGRRGSGVPNNAVGGNKQNMTPNLDPSAERGKSPKMITLRNPMFHGGNTMPTASVLQQSSLQPGQNGNISMPSPIPTDQPAAIIKNDNGMFTIRNPALHQAVTNGLMFGGYRPYSGANYYSPMQEQSNQSDSKSPFEAACAGGGHSSSANSNRPFSYFSDSGILAGSQTTTTTTASTYPTTSNSASTATITPPPSSQHATYAHDGLHSPNALNISCSNIGNSPPDFKDEIGKPKVLSAIGSEIKNAQNYKAKPIENIWSAFSHDLSDALPLKKQDNLLGSSFCGASSNNNGLSGNSSLQERYKNSSYYNGYDMFSNQQYSSNARHTPTNTNSSSNANSNTNSLFSGSTCHMHHRCDDDSPPPTVTGYNSYLKDIPNTGVIRYDNASYLKNLISGQNLSNEISILNVNESNYNRNKTSPVAHHVEITPIFRPQQTRQHTLTNPQPQSQSQHSGGQYKVSSSTLHGDDNKLHDDRFKLDPLTNYEDHIAEFRNDLFNRNKDFNRGNIDTQALNPNRLTPTLPTGAHTNPLSTSTDYYNGYRSQSIGDKDLNIDLRLDKTPPPLMGNTTSNNRKSPYADTMQNLNPKQMPLLSKDLYGGGDNSGINECDGAANNINNKNNNNNNTSTSWW